MNSLFKVYNGKTKISLLDDHVEINGIKVSIEVMEAITSTTQKGTYLRFERKGDRMEVSSFYSAGRN